VGGHELVDGVLALPHHQRTRGRISDGDTSDDR
jgi:hypothetical protein